MAVCARRIRFIKHYLRLFSMDIHKVKTSFFKKRYSAQFLLCKSPSTITRTHSQQKRRSRTCRNRLSVDQIGSIYFKISSITGISTFGLITGKLKFRSVEVEPSFAPCSVLAVILISDASCRNCAYFTFPA